MRVERDRHEEREAGVSRHAIKRARIEYTVVDGLLRGSVILPGEPPRGFESVAELERCLGVGPGRLVLVESAEPDERPHDDLAVLTATERAIVEAVAAGASNREIAETMFYSVKSVEAYLTRIYRRLCVEGRAGLVSVANGADDLEVPEQQTASVTGGAPVAPLQAAASGRSLIVEFLLV